MKAAFLVTALLLILAANLIMVSYAPRGLMGREGFDDVSGDVSGDAGVPNNGSNLENGNTSEGFNSYFLNDLRLPNNWNNISNGIVLEGFNSYFLENAGGAKEKYSPVGAFDGVKLSTGNNVSGWRYTAPNEALTGAEFQPGPDNLFMFKNNQCKPECCGASFSCGGGCVCTTPKQRNYIAGRGGNSTVAEGI